MLNENVWFKSKKNTFVVFLVLVFVVAPKIISFLHNFLFSSIRKVEGWTDRRTDGQMDRWTDRRADRQTDGQTDILMTFLTNVRSDKHQVGQISGRTNIGSDKWRILYRSDKWRILCIGRTNSRLDKWRILCIGRTNDAFYIGRTNVESDSRTNCGVHFWRSQKTRGIILGINLLLYSKYFYRDVNGKWS